MGLIILDSAKQALFLHTNHALNV